MIDLNVKPFTDLGEVAQATMRFLHERLGLGLWMFTRVEKDDWVILDTLGTSYPTIAAGTVLRWSDSFCSRMIAGQGPMLAPSAMDVPAYREAPVAKALPIESYVGIPIYRSNGDLFGTMCAIDPQPASLPKQEQALVELVARTLGFAVDRQFEADEASRRAERAETEALTDALTGLYNRRGWDDLVSREEDRCRRYGYPACAVVVDLDGFKQINDQLGHATGDRVLQRVAATLLASFRTHDIVARTGGDEFSILAVESDGSEGLRLCELLEARLVDNEITASVGLGYRPTARLTEIWKAADEAMYRVKRGEASNGRRLSLAPALPLSSRTG